MSLQKKVKELAVTNALTDAYLLLQEIKELKRSLSLELDFQRDRRKAQEDEFRYYVRELWETLRKIQAQFRIEAELLNLIKPGKAGEKRWQGSNSGRQSIHERSVGKTR